MTENPLVVVIGCDTFPPDINGAARFAERLAAGLAKRGHELHVVAPATSKRYGSFREVHDGVPMVVHRLKSLRIPQHAALRYVWPFTLRKRTDNLLNQIKPDVVHIQSQAIVGRYLTLSARERGIRVIATNHTMPENLIRYSVIIPRFAEKLAMRIWWKDTAKVLARAEVVTTPTRLAANILEENTGLTGVLAISCGIDARKFAHAPEVSNEKPRALFVGRLDYEKHVHILIEAFAKVPRNLAATLEIVGDGNERESLERWAAEQGVSDRVIFSGHVTEEQLKAAYANSTVFVMPSVAELQSIATMEAMATGRPVLAANAAALPHLVHNGENGYLFEPENVDELAARLKQMFTADSRELKHYAHASLHLIQSHDINTTLDIFEQIYRGQAASLQTADNLSDYGQPVPEDAVLSEMVAAIRKSAAALASAAGDLRDGVLERLSDVRGEVVERFEEMGYEVLRRSKKAQKRIERVIARTLERFRRHDR